MSNLKWLRGASTKKANQIMDLSDEYWDVILDGAGEPPESLKNSPHALGKFSVLSTLGLMMYIPGMAKEFAATYGRQSDEKTGAGSLLESKSVYLSTVGQGIQAAAEVITRWESESKGAPKLGSSDTTEELRRFMPLFQERLSDKAMRKKQEKEAEQGQMEPQSLLGGEDVDQIN